ncbi:PIN domain-containing protein [Nocardia takedensis]|uniref:PIN domain-containing protein n=1 Tax=Nocardia takedensis TaxID=259390 RepID=UPI003F76510D
MLEAPSITFDQRAKAVLLLSIIGRAVDQPRAYTDLTPGEAVADLANPTVFGLFIRAATDWADDEAISALTMSIAINAPGSTLTENQITSMREHADAHFARHGESGILTRVSMEDNDLGPLIEILRRGESRQKALEELAENVRNGQFPLAVLAEAAGRTTTECLICRDLGYVMAIEDDARLGEQAARAAFDSRIVVDVTALVVARWSGRRFKKLAANFDAVLIPSPLRDDIARARTVLARRTTDTLGWDIRAQRPSLTTISPESAAEYADLAEQVWTDARNLQILPIEAAHLEQWSSAITAAQQLGIALWADDNVLRRIARATGVQAFGTLDLIRAIGGDSDIIEAEARFRANRVVDLPIDQPWHHCAIEAAWQTDSPFGLAISRPAAWRNIPDALIQFRSLIRSRPDNMDPKTIADWTHLAANGLAAATEPTARHRTVSTLLAWTIVTTDPYFATLPGIFDDHQAGDRPGQVTERIIIVSDQLRERYHPAADNLAALLDVLCASLFDSAGPELTSRIIANLARRLDRSIGERLFAAYFGRTERTS